MPRELVYFTDWCLGPRVLPAALREADMQVVTHDEFGLAHDELDVVWIPKVASRGYIILTADKRIRRDPLELRAVVTSRARYFAVTRSDRSALANAEIIIRHRLTIETLFRRARGHLVAQLNANEVLVRDRRGRLVRANV